MQLVGKVVNTANGRGEIKDVCCLKQSRGCKFLIALNDGDEMWIDGAYVDPTPVQLIENDSLATSDGTSEELARREAQALVGRRFLRYFTGNGLFLGEVRSVSKVEKMWWCEVTYEDGDKEEMDLEELSRWMNMDIASSTSQNDEPLEGTMVAWIHIQEEGGDGTEAFRIGEVISAENDNLTILAYGCYQAPRKGKSASRTQKDKWEYYPAYVDPRDEKEIYTEKPLVRYSHIQHECRSQQLLVRNFMLTRSCIPPTVRKFLESKTREIELQDMGKEEC